MPSTRAPRIPPGEVTRLLHAWGEGDVQARDRLVPFVYEELRRRAAQHLRHERRAHTLRPTDLVHDTFLRLRSQNAGWQNRETVLRGGLAPHAAHPRGRGASPVFRSS